MDLLLEYHAEVVEEDFDEAEEVSPFKMFLYFSYKKTLVLCELNAFLPNFFLHISDFALLIYIIWLMLGYINIK